MLGLLDLPTRSAIRAMVKVAKVMRTQYFVVECRRLAGTERTTGKAKYPPGHLHNNKWGWMGVPPLLLRCFLHAVHGTTYDIQKTDPSNKRPTSKKYSELS